MESLLRVSEIHEQYLKDKINIIELYRIVKAVPANKYRVLKFNNKYTKHYDLEAVLQAFQDHESKKQYKWRKYDTTR